jgi:hypothetical protein
VAALVFIRPRQVHLKIKSTPRLAKSYLQQISVCKLIRKTYIYILLDQRQSWR